MSTARGDGQGACIRPNTTGAHRRRGRRLPAAPDSRRLGPASSAMPRDVVQVHLSAAGAPQLWENASRDGPVGE